MTNCFKGKTVIVTGASSGIGQALAVEYAKHGTNLVIGGRNTDQLQKTKNQCIKSGLKENQVVLVAGDIADEHIQKQLVDAAINTFHKLDILVNNAGLFIGSRVSKLKMDDFDRTHNVNLRAAVSLSSMALPHLIKTKGNIVNISSVASWIPITSHLSYAISKAGLDMFTKTLAFEVAPKGVRVNSVNPSIIPTNIDRGVPQKTEAQQERWDAMVNKLHPIGRCGKIKEVVDAAIFLSSDQSTFITGHLLPVDGGSGLRGVLLSKM